MEFTVNLLYQVPTNRPPENNAKRLLPASAAAAAAAAAKSLQSCLSL